jgi:hypothetical protein
MKMQDIPQSPEAAGWAATVLAHLSAWTPHLQAFLWKFMPVPLGALVMVVFDPPKTRRELFTRLTVAYMTGNLLAGFVFDLLDSFAFLAFLDATNRRHVGAVEFFTAGCGWTLLSMFATYQRRLRESPPDLPDVTRP